jgi:NitT/TauT family transport system ATP-binding protein
MINVTALCKKYNGTLVLSRITFSADREIVSIVGESGCGKTTLLKTICGVLPYDLGEIKYEGSLGYVPQGLGLAWWLSVEDNIRLGNKEISTSKVSEVIKLMGLKGREKEKPYCLSGGMRQRVALARALVGTPDLLLLDEPFGSLDELTRERLNVELYSSWRGLATTVLLVTHSIREALYISDRVLILSDKPASIKKDIRIDTPHPRKWADPKTFFLERHIKECLIG